MPSLSEKLKSLGVKKGVQNLHKPERDGLSIEEVVSGDFWTTPKGEVFVVENIIQSTHPSLNISSNKHSPPLDIIAKWAGVPQVADMSLNKFAFLDTETSGLAGGTGTYAFLIGAGKFEDNSFKIAQFFLKDPAEEPAQLAALEQFLAPCKVFVTFNGKSFDIPILNTRYISHGWPPPFNSHPNLDLLHLARRLWRRRLSSRTLGNLEVEILGTVRSQDDVPGWMIPQMYFDFLRSGNAEPLTGVFYHNQMDILSMVALLDRMTAMLSNPLENIQHASDLLAVGKLFEDIKLSENATSIYQHCLGTPLTNELWLEAVRRLSYIFKRQDNYHAAIELWRVAAKNGEIYAFEELAKVYEHRFHDYELALKWTMEALQLVSDADFPVYEQFRWKGSLEHRMGRLTSKIE